MYSDYSPIPNYPPTEENTVLVIEGTETNKEEAMNMARGIGATSTDPDGCEIFWVVYAQEPKRIWDMTEESFSLKY